MMPKAIGLFARDNNFVYRTEAKLVWGTSNVNLGLVIMLNPGSSKLADNKLWDDLENKKVYCAEGELVLDETMKR